MKKQIIAIHGGETFNGYKAYLTYLKNYKIDTKKAERKRWKERLAQRLGKNFQVISPRMPNPMNAKYKEWKIIFEKLFPFLKNNLILLGHSLGGIFLTKYLSENKFPKKILAVFLVAAPFDETAMKSASEDELADFSLPKNLVKLEKQAGKIYLIQSKDDKIVPFANFKKYQKALPSAKTMIFKNRGHFNQPEFPEIVKEIRNVFLMIAEKSRRLESIGGADSLPSNPPLIPRAKRGERVQHKNPTINL